MIIKLESLMLSHDEIKSLGLNSLNRPMVFTHTIVKDHTRSRGLLQIHENVLFVPAHLPTDDVVVMDNEGTLFLVPHTCIEELKNVAHLSDVPCAV